MRSARVVAMMVALVTLGVMPVAVFAQASEPAPAPSAQNPAPEPEKKEQIPPVAHTGWATLAKDTANDFLVFPRRKATWVLLGGGAVAALAAHPGDDYVEEHIVGSNAADKTFKLGRWVGSANVQIGTAVGLWVIGRYVLPQATDQPQTNKWSHLGFDLLRAQMESQALVHAIKYTVRRDRPTGECCAFPSGHATTAFATAAVLERHFGYRGSWPAMAAAAYVATSRLVDNRHFLSDVIFGAALGTATGWTVVGRHGREQYALRPMPVRGGFMIGLARVESPRYERTE